MSLFGTHRKTFDITGKDKIQVIVGSIKEFEVGPYEIATGVYQPARGMGEIQAGHSVTIGAAVKKYWRNEQIVHVDHMSVHIKIDSSPERHRFELGVIGGGIFESASNLEVELSVEPWCVRDIVDELRQDPNRGIRVDGYAISDRVFRVAYFLLSRGSVARAR